MPSEQPIIVTSETGQPDGQAPVSGQPERPGRPSRKIILAIVLGAIFIILAALIFFAVKNNWLATKPPSGETAATSSAVASSSPATLPGLNPIEVATSTVATSSFSNLAIEYLSFSDFYEAPDNKMTPKINDYELPLNVKIDVMNYYDVSRKLSLDASLDQLNNSGSAVINNPWYQEASDFYSLYGTLSTKQIPVMVTADFLIYYYQSVMKKAFKDVEENVFYDNLWDINKELYQVAKNRYETHLTEIGSVNDSVLEGERLETAFFAAALELLKPEAKQLASKGAVDDGSLFVAEDADRFYFTVPPYLRDDVLAEVKLIKAANQPKAKSPVFLYNRDYRDFVVPSDYKSNAKLNNFYLTTKWLNSVFPLNYRGKGCPTCLLDQADWRINLIASSLISQDFSSLPELKNKWARIYKVMFFFKGLREDLNYVHYRDSLVALFGSDYKIRELFDDQNPKAGENLEKLRAKLLAYEFPALSGALSKTDALAKPNLGFKMLSESYWPNNYIFSRLTAPSVGVYQGTSTRANLSASNVTICTSEKNNNRCNGCAFDTVNLVYPIVGNPYFAENTNYLNYGQEATRLRGELDKAGIWRLNNYWLTLSLARSYLTMDKNNLPLFARSANWQDRSLRTAAGAWINFQLPLEKFSVNPVFQGQNLNSFSRWSENSYVEPNLALINELIANNNMILKMFSALQLDADVRLALQDIRNFSGNLISLRKIVIKELTSEKLTTADNELIADFTKQLKTEASATNQKQLYIKLPQQKDGLREDLSRLQLLVLIHQEGDNKVFSVGPVWDYRESH